MRRIPDSCWSLPLLPPLSITALFEQEWQSLPLDRGRSLVVFIDALMVKIRDRVVANRPVYPVRGRSVPVDQPCDAEILREPGEHQP
jgi:hypothetical protein